MKKFSLILLFIVICSFNEYAQAVHSPPGKYFFVITFNQSMDTTSLKNLSNYTIFDQYMNEVEVLNAAIGYYPITHVCADSLVVLLVNAPNYKTTYTVRVDSVYNKEGILISNTANSAWYFFDGYDPNESKPYLILD